MPQQPYDVRAALRALRGFDLLEEEPAGGTGPDAALREILTQFQTDGDLDAAIAAIQQALAAPAEIDPAEIDPTDDELTESVHDRPRRGGLTPADRAELARLRAEKECRQLCESSEFQPTRLQLSAIAGVRPERRRQLIAMFRRQAASAGDPPARDLVGDAGEYDVDEAMNALLGPTRSGQFRY